MRGRESEKHRSPPKFDSIIAPALDDWYSRTEYNDVRPLPLLLVDALGPQYKLCKLVNYTPHKSCTVLKLRTPTWSATLTRWWDLVLRGPEGFAIWRWGVNQKQTVW